MQRRRVRRRGGVRASVAAGLIAFLSGAACVDLFHSTDFPSLCSTDPSACGVEGGPETGVDGALTEEASAPIDLCAGSSAEARARAERACGYLGACLGTTDTATLGQCMVRGLAAFDCELNPSLRPRGATAGLWDCLWRAQTCDQVARCVFGTSAPMCKGGSSGGSFTACNVAGGAVVVECGDDTKALGMNPCMLQGRRCAAVDQGKSICAGAQGTSCSDPKPRCKGTAAVQCVSAGGIDADIGIDCAGYGAGACEEDGEGVACAPDPSAPACESTSKVICKGSTVESCVSNKAVRFDCSAIGAGCNATGVLSSDPLRACVNVDAGTRCNTTIDDCDGGTLRSCAQGMPFDLKCTTVTGLGACVPVAGRATCAPPD